MNIVANYSLGHTEATIIGKALVGLLASTAITGKLMRNGAVELRVGWTRLRYTCEVKRQIDRSAILPSNASAESDLC